MSEGLTWTALRRIAAGGGLFTDGDWVETPFITDVGVRLIQTGNIGVGKYREQGYRYISNESFGVLGCTEVRPGDLLISRLADPVGRSCIAPDLGVRMITSVDVAILRPRAGAADNRYLNYYMASSRHLDAVAAIARGGTRERISRDQLGAVVVPLPQLSEQRAIADYLDRETARIDALIAAKQRMAKVLEVRFWAAFTQSVFHVSARQTQMRRVLTSLIDGPFGSAFSSADYAAEGPAVVRLGNIGFAEYRHTDQAHIPLELYERFRAYRVVTGDLLIAGLGDDKNHAGRACIAPDLGDAIVKGKCFRGRVDSGRCSAEFLALLLSSPLGANAMGVSGRGSTRSMINLEVVKSTEMPIPARETQEAIVDRTAVLRTATETAAAVIQQQLALLSERRQALITAVVTGGLPVPVAA
jgi:type I restriction enzyme S subunit